MVVPLFDEQMVLFYIPASNGETTITYEEDGPLLQQDVDVALSECPLEVCNILCEIHDCTSFVVCAIDILGAFKACPPGTTNFNLTATCVAPEVDTHLLASRKLLLDFVCNRDSLVATPIGWAKFTFPKYSLQQREGNLSHRIVSTTEHQTATIDQDVKILLSQCQSHLGVISAKRNLATCSGKSIPATVTKTYL